MPNPALSVKRIAFAIIALLLIQQNLHSQTPVTGFYTNFNGFWKSEASQQNSIRPDCHHDLIAFTLNGKLFSTGVSDYSLFTRGISYTPAIFRPFPVGALPIDTPSTRLLLAGDSVLPGYASTYPGNLLFDGQGGLDLGSSLSVVSKKSLSIGLGFFNGITPAAIGDSVPDILFTQMADFVGSADRIYFVDQYGVGVGSPIFPGFLASQTIGKWKANSFDVKGNRLEQDAEQPMMAMAADLSDFGITAAMASRVFTIRYDFNGSTVPAFIAFNTASISGPANIVSGDRFTTQLAPVCCGGSNTRRQDFPPYAWMTSRSGNYNQQSGIPITVSILSGPANHGPLSGVLTELTDSTGQATFRNMILPCEEGTYVLSFSYAGLTQASSLPITLKTPVYYPVSSGFNDLSKLSNWRNSANGIGLPPTDFGPGQIFMLSNSANHTEFRTGGNWTVGGRLVMPAGSKLTINGGSRLKIQCSLENNGSVLSEPGSWLEYAGSSRQNISGNFSLKSLAIANSSSVRTLVPLAVDTLTITAGRLLIDDNDIFVNLMSGGAPQTFVRTEGKGRVLSVVSPFVPKQFQVGNVFYNPATVNIQPPYSDTIAVRVLNEVRVNGTSGDIITDPRIQATWNIESSDARAAAAAAANGQPYTPKLELGFELQYSGLQNTGIGLPALYAFDGKWKNITTNYATCNFPCQYPQVRGFKGTTSLFYMGSGSNIALPVSFEKFTAELIQNNARLNWQTAQEYNIRDYSVMYSSDGLDWKVAGNVALSEKRNYLFSWNGLTKGKNYFRIRENDKDGNYSYSAVRVLELNKPELISVSNPVINGSTTLTLATAMQISLFDPAGRLIWKKSFSAGSHRVDVSTVQRGIYLLKYEGGVSRLMVP